MRRSGPARGVTVGLILAVLWGAGIVALGRSRAPAVHPAALPAGLPFPLIQPSPLPDGVTLLQVQTTAPAAGPDGRWTVQLAYGARRLYGPSPVLEVYETWPVHPGPDGRTGAVVRWTTPDGTPAAQVQAAKGGYAFVVTGFGGPAASVAQIAASLLARSLPLAGPPVPVIRTPPPARPPLPPPLPMVHVPGGANGCVGAGTAAPAFRVLPPAPPGIPYALPADLGGEPAGYNCLVGVQKVSASGYEVVVGVMNAPVWPQPGSVPSCCMIVSLGGSRRPPVPSTGLRKGTPTLTEVAGHRVSTYPISGFHAPEAVAQVGAFTLDVIGRAGTPAAGGFSTASIMRDFLDQSAAHPLAPGARRGQVDLYWGDDMRPLFSAWWTYDGKVFYGMWTLQFGGGIPMLASVVRPGG